MFKIFDGRDHFYQWDLDRQIEVEDATITEVHFCNRTDDCSLVVDVEELTIFADGKEFIRRVANVPNIILQKSFDVRVFGYDGKATRYDKVFKVKPRTRPADYVYTETEVRNFDTLSEELNEEIDERLENIADEIKDNLDLSAYYTKEETDNLISNINECDTYYFDPEAIEWQTGINNPTHAPDDLVEFAQKVLAGEHVNLWIKDPYWQPTRFAIYSNDNVHFQRINTPYPGTEQKIQPYQVYLRTDGIWAVYKLSPIKYFYADDDYVNTAIRTALSGIAQAEGGAY